jgi:hypothetical protein
MRQIPRDVEMPRRQRAGESSRFVVEVEKRRIAYVIYPL